MAGLFFKHQNYPAIQTMGGIRVQTSLYGTCLPIVYGRNRIAANLIYYSNFQSTPVNSKGGKGGIFGAGGKGGQQVYDYGAAVILALCQGPISGVGAVWDTQGTLPVNDTSETYTIGGPHEQYQVTNYNTFIADLGVSEANPYSVSANDYGSPGPVILTGTQQTPMTKVSGSPSAGQYSQSNGTYQFSSADAGINVTINYSYGPPNTIGSDPITSLNLTFFDGAQGQTPWSWLTTNYPSQALGYTLLAYAASSRLDLGTSGALPNLTFEIHGILTNPNGGNGDCNPSDVLYDLLTNSIYGCGLTASEIGSWLQYSAYCSANGIFISPVLDTQRTASEYIDEWLTATNSELVRVGFQLVVLPYGDTTAVGNGATFTPQTQPIYSLDDDDYIYQSGEDPVLTKRPSVQDAYNVVRVEYVDRGNDYNPNVVAAEDLRAEELYLYRPESPRQYHFICEQSVAATVAQTLLARLVFIRNTHTFKLPGSYILLNPMDLVNAVDPSLPGYPNPSPVRVKTMSENEDGELEMEVEEFPWGCSGPTIYPKQSATSGFVQANADPGPTNQPILFEAVPRLRGGDPQQELWMALSGNSIPVSFAQPNTNASGATGHAIVVNGEVNSIIIDSNGSGFTNASAVIVTFSAYQGSGATANVVLSGGGVNYSAIISGGTNYASAWGGCRVWLSTDGMQYTAVGTQQGASTMGVTTADWAASSDPDSTNDLKVDLSMSNGSLPNFTETQENNFASMFYVAGGYGQILYELGAYATAVLTAPNKYTLKATTSSGSLYEASINNGGLLYQVGNVCNVAGGTGGTVIILEVDATGKALEIALDAPGSGYSTTTGAATSGGSGTGLTLNIDIDASNYLRRNVFGAPGAATGGVDHPSGSAFCAINQNIFKIAIDSTLAGSTIYLKFTSFNFRENMEESLANVPAYTFALQALQQGLYGYSYQIVPLNPFYQDPTTSTQLDISPFKIQTTAGMQSYLGTTIPGLSSSGTYYVYVYDPGFRGENATLGITCTYAALVTQAYQYEAGWFYLGDIVMSGGGGSGGTITGENDGSMSGTSFSASTVHAPIVPGSFTVAVGSYNGHDDGSGNIIFSGYNPVVVGGTVSYAGSYSIHISSGAIGTVYSSYRYT